MNKPNILKLAKKPSKPIVEILVMCIKNLRKSEERKQHQNVESKRRDYLLYFLNLLKSNEIHFDKLHVILNNDNKINVNVKHGVATILVRSQVLHIYIFIITQNCQVPFT